MTDFSAALHLLWPNGDWKIPGLRAGMILTAPYVCVKYNVTDPLVFAHIMAQISHECGAGSDVVENLSYSPQRLIQVWPRHFNSGNAAAYAYNPQKLGDFIYNPPQHNDLGNRPDSNDGYLYRGRGGSQTTGRAAYTALAAKTGMDLVNDPDKLNDPKCFLDCAFADFIMCGCMPFAEKDDIVGVTKKLNGGLIGLDQRKQWLAKWKGQHVAIPPIPTNVPMA
jgi:putative chitinase